MNRMRKGKHGQAMTEYIIIVAIIALAALAIFGLFGDQIRDKVGGAVNALGGDASEDTTPASSADYLKTLSTDTGGTP